MATSIEPTTLDQLAIQMADWVHENVGGLSQREAEGLEQEFKRLVALLPPHHDDPDRSPYPPSRQEPFTGPLEWKPINQDIIRTHTLTRAPQAAR